MDAEERIQMKEQSHKHKPTDDLTYEERVWWYRGFTSGWIANSRQNFRADLQTELVRRCVAVIDTDGLEVAAEEFDGETLRLALPKRR